MMKHLIRYATIAIAIFFSTNILAQFVDDFTDGDFTNNPTWTGMASHFQVNSSNELWLNAPAITSTSRLVTPCNAIGNAQYDFRVRLGFDPSGSNYAKVYLTSTDSNLSGSLDGYYVRIGGASGTIDDVSLFHQSGTNSTKIIDGTNGTVALTPEVDVRVTRDMQGNWELLIDTALNGVFVSEGTVFNNQVIVSNYFGVYCIYTSTRSDKFFFDNFNVVGGPIMDVDPPVLDSAVALSLTQVDVYFNEKVDQNTSEMTSNYDISNGIGNPSSATRDVIDTSLVHLAFTTPLLNNTIYNLLVVNVEDFSGNAIGSQNTNFTTTITTPSSYGDIVINEIFADPTPQIGLPDAEYIELYNNTNSSINIGNWVYRDGSSSVQLPNYNLNANKYVILCDEDDTTLFNGFGDVLGLSTWPSLNNSGDQLGIRDVMNNLIDSVSYQDSWYQDASKSSGGWSLERINPLAPCSDVNNWKASNNIDGGTPGIQNSIFNNQPKNDIPEVQLFSIQSTDQIELVFSKSLDTNGISTANFVIDNGVSVVDVNVQNLNTVLVEVNPSMTSTDIYNLVVTGIEDCYGNSILDTTLKIAIGRSANPYDLVFTEIYPNPNPLNIAIPEAEFVEIYNRSQDPITLGGMSFGDRSTVVNLPNEVIFPGEYVTLVEDIAVADFQKFGRVVSLSSWPSLNNSGDLIILQTSFDTIDMVLYSDSWYENSDKKSTGWSLELINPEVLCLGLHNWTGSQAIEQATPSQKNSVFNDAHVVDFNVESASAVQLNKIELVFSKNLDLGTIIPANFIIDHSISVVSAQLNSEMLNVVELIVSPQLSVGIVYNITANNITDCAGASLNNNVGEVKLPGFQDVLVNEILFNPNTGGSDFIELYNRTDQDIDIKNWNLLYYNNSGDSAYKSILSTTYILKPNQFVVLTEDSANIKHEYANSMDGTFLEMDLPTYSNAEGEVIVLNQMGLLNDQFAYNENMHFEILNSVKGVSLERINYLTGTNTSNNWHSAASTSDFATPGFTNSQYLMSATGSGNVTVSPKTFSPNNDGYKDVLSIAYQFKSEGYVATVTIHNADGQLINTLINNQSVGIEGAFQWDGINDNGELMPTGMYIVMMRVFDLENNQQVFKNVAVLAMP